MAARLSTKEKRRRVALRRVGRAVRDFLPDEDEGPDFPEEAAEALSRLTPASAEPKGEPAAPAITFRPQPGPQTAFLSTTADIAIYGGAAGGGKTFACLLSTLRHRDNPGFHAVIFRRTGVAIRNSGGLWDASVRLFPFIGASGSRADLRWKFPSGATLKMSHMESEDDRFAWQGTELPLIIFDELTHFTEKQFWYLLSRNRSTTGIPGRIRATCNPDPDSFVAALISWWIDRETGLPIPERAGKVRWFVRVGDSDVTERMEWADSREELAERFPGSAPKSLTFIPAKVEDNRILLDTDKAYLANLLALPYVDRMRLLGGNWLVKPTAGSVFRRSWFDILKAMPHTHRKTVRVWDRAATVPNAKNPEPDWSAGVKVSYDGERFIVEDVIRLQGRPFEVSRAMLQAARMDGTECAVAIYQDPGSAGVAEAEATVKALAGFHVVVRKVTVNKVVAAKPASTQAEARNIVLLSGPWNAAFLAEAEAFPDGPNDDQIDGLSGAVAFLTEGITKKLAAEDFAVASGGYSGNSRFVPRSRA